jgi:chromosome segregation ATPase
MEAADRRKLTDSIIMLDNDRIKKENAKELSTAKTNFEIANSDRNRIQDEITELKKIIAHMEDEKKANIAQMEATVVDKRTLVEHYKVQSGALSGELQALQNRLAELKSVLDTEPSIDAAIASIHNAKAQVIALQQFRTNLDAANGELTAAMNSYNALPVQAKKDELAAIDKQIGELNFGLQVIMTEIGEINADKATAEGVVNKWDYALQQASTQLKKLADDGKKRKADLDHVDEQINLGAMMQAGTKCPTCGHTLTEADIEEHRGEIRQKLIDDINADVSRLRNDWVQCKGKVTELERNRADAAAEVAKFAGELPAANERRASVEQQLATLTANRGAVYNEIQGFSAIYNSTIIPAETKVEQLKRNISMCEQVIAGTGINVDEFVAEEARLTQEKERISGVRTEWQSAYDTYSAKNGEYSSLSGSITQVEAEITRIEGEITRIKEATSEDALAMTNKRLADAERDLEQATERWHTASKTIAACNYITGMLSDGGMKKMVYGLYIDHFNEVVRKNLLRANLPFVIEFDDTMNFKFISAPGYAPSYTMLSQGQRRKVGFAIAMAFRDFVSLVGNFSINFMSLDEVLDISTDNYAMREMLDIVRSMVSEIGCVVVITHRGDAVADKFDHKIVVEYDGTYSHMGEVTAV